MLVQGQEKLHSFRVCVKVNWNSVHVLSVLTFVNCDEGCCKFECRLRNILFHENQLEFHGI